MKTDVNQAYCGGHFAIYTNIQSLCCMAETNKMLYVIKRKREREREIEGGE